jgi:hypothetical protein
MGFGGRAFPCAARATRFLDMDFQSEKRAMARGRALQDCDEVPYAEIHSAKRRVNPDAHRTASIKSRTGAGHTFKCEGDCHFYDQKARRRRPRTTQIMRFIKNHCYFSSGSFAKCSPFLIDSFVAKVRPFLIPLSWCGLN